MNVILAYKNFAANRNISHIGLGVAALNTQKVLYRAGIAALVWPIINAAHLAVKLQQTPATHVIVSAPWIPTVELQKLAIAHPQTHFTVCCHSNVGFLQADRNGVKLLRDVIDLELGTHNVHLAGNCRRFCDWVNAAFNAPCAYLPNLYYLDENAAAQPSRYNGGTLRIGAFGAQRPLKNFMSAAAAALQIAKELQVPLEFWMSGGRPEGGGDVVIGAIKEMLSGIPGVTFAQTGWMSWPQFRKFVGSMHLLLQPSYTESFNMVSADGVAEGVPSVVSEAINWLPRNWTAAVDDSNSIARVGRSLLADPFASRDGLRALTGYVRDGLASYQQFFSQRS